MLFTESQLDAFSRPQPKYETNAIIRTHETIREALRKHLQIDSIKNRFQLSGFEYVDYLQGSYSNDTSIKSSSDVDIVVEYTRGHYYSTDDLSPQEKDDFNRNLNPTNYSHAEFKNDVYSALVGAFGSSVIQRRNKCIYFKAHGNYIDADIIPCWSYRRYMSFTNTGQSKYHQGIKFRSDSGIEIYNYPKLHQDALIQKSKNTNGNFKQTVRLFKNLRDELALKGLLQQELAPSYFVENLIYTVPDAMYAGTQTDRVKAIVANLIQLKSSPEYQKLTCAHGLQWLFGSTTWNENSCSQFISALGRIV